MLKINSHQRPSAKQCLKHEWFSDIMKVEPNQIEESIERLLQFSVQKKIAIAIYWYIVSQLIDTQEFNDLKQGFISLDRDQDGRISHKDLLKSFKKVEKYKVSKEEGKQIFNILDINNSGYLEWDKFLIACLQWNKILVEDKILGQVIQILAPENQIKIEKQQFYQFFRGKLDEEQIQDILQEIQFDEKDSISTEQFRELMLDQ